MNVLLLQHFESYWEGPLQELHNTSFEECMNNVLDFVASNDNIDKIIITLFEDYELNHEYEKLQTLCDKKGIEIEAHTYAYAWYKDPDPEETAYPESTRNIDWCQGTRDHHGEEDVIEINDWQKELKYKNCKVFLGGAFDGECVKDQEAALDTLEVNYERVEGLIVGSGVNYEPLLGNLEEIESSLMCLMIDMEEEYNDLLSDCDNDEDLLIEEYLDELVEIEKKLNDFVTEHRKEIEAFDIEYSTGTDMVNDVIHESIRDNNISTKYSDMADERNLNVIKLKLKSNDEVAVVETPKSKKRLTM